jgi:hypothetical protein
VAIKIGFEGMDTQALSTVQAALRELFGADSDLVFEPAGARERDCDIILVRGTATDWNELRRNRDGALLVNLVEEGSGAPEALVDGQCDAAVAMPFRVVDIITLLRMRSLTHALRDYTALQDQVVRAVDRLEEDVALAESLQSRMLPRRFTDVRGFQIHNRYLAGLRGGDWFDLAESRDGSAIHLVLSDGSSSGLSSGVGAALTRVAMRVSLESARSPVDTVRALHEELQALFSEKHRLSLLYGILSRSDLKFRWLALGQARLYHARGGNGFRALEVQGGVLKKGESLRDDLSAGELNLEPQDRILMLSDGFIDGVGGEQEMERLIGQPAGKAEGMLNDLAWRIRKGLSDDELPAQECTALWLEVDSNVIRLAR